MPRIVTLYFYLEEVPLSNMLTIENRVKRIAPNPAKIRAGILVFCYKISGMGMAVA
ncbi:hypothetical protein JCM10556A_41750 [Bacteroides acidifaciens]